MQLLDDERRADKPLTRKSVEELTELARKLFSAASPDGRSVNGWIAPIDYDVKSSSQFSTPEIKRRRDLLDTRWSDVYFQEIDRQLTELKQLSTYFDEMRAKAVTRMIEQYEADSNEAVHNDEVTAGWYQLQKEISGFDADAQRKWADATKRAHDIAVRAYNEMSSALTNFSADTAATLKAYATALPMFSAYRTVHMQAAPNNSEFTCTLDLGQNVNHGKLPPIIPKCDSLLGNWALPHAVFYSAKSASLPETIYFFSNVEAQQELSLGAYDSAELTAKSKKRLFDWNTADVDFRRRRTELAIEVNALKRKSSSDARAPLNYYSELDVLRGEFLDLFSDVYSKSLTVVDGLKNLWQWTSIGSCPDPNTWTETSGSYLAAFVRWHMEVKRVSAALGAKECATAIPVSMKNLIGTNAWQTAVHDTQANNRPALTLSFALPASLLTGCYGLRLRGISAYVAGVDDKKAGVWRGTLRPPLRTQVTDFSGANHAFAQALPAIDLSRIQSRAFPRPPDVVGMTTLRNASPLSDSTAAVPDANWLLTLARRSSLGTDVITVSDVEIDFLMAATLR